MLSPTAPTPAVRLSPIAATTSMSPGFSWCTDFGRVADRNLSAWTHGKGSDLGTRTCFRCGTKMEIGHSFTKFKIILFKIYAQFL